MIRVIVDRPVGEDHLGLLAFQEMVKLIVVGAIHDRFAVNLSRKGGPRLENLAGFLGFRHAHGAGVVRWLVRPLAPVEVEQDDLVPQVSVAGDGATAAVFRVAGMTTGDHHLELGPCCWQCFAGQWITGGGWQWQASSNGGPQQAGFAQHVSA